MFGPYVPQGSSTAELVREEKESSDWFTSQSEFCNADR